MLLLALFVLYIISTSNHRCMSSSTIKELPSSFLSILNSFLTDFNKDALVLPCVVQMWDVRTRSLSWMYCTENFNTHHKYDVCVFLTIFHTHNEVMVLSHHITILLRSRNKKMFLLRWGILLLENILAINFCHKISLRNLSFHPHLFSSWNKQGLLRCCTGPQQHDVGSF